MALFVLNEWLWAYASGDPGAQHRALEVVTRLAKSNHQIIVITGSPFERKAFACCKSHDVACSKIGAAFHRMIRLNSDRCRLLDATGAPALTDAFVAVKDDDRYLIQAQLSAPGSVLITTDQPLREIVQAAGRECLSPAEFIATYLQDQQ